MSLPLKIDSARGVIRHDFRGRLTFALIAGALVGAGVAALSPGSFWIGWLSASFLAAISFFFLHWAWTWGGRGRLLAWMMILAFSLRLAIGIGLSLALPVWGYDKDCQKQGYLFKDACARDQEAYSIALKGEGLYWFSGIKLDNDQYGGLSFLSGWIYRFLSPDAHRAFLILILGAAFAAFGVPFLFRAVSLHWPVRAAVLAAWIYVLYPDAIFFSASQMREPFQVGLSAVAIWAVLSWKNSLRTSALVFALSAVGILFFSFRIALMIVGVLLVWFWLEFSGSRREPYWKTLGWLGLAAGLLLIGGLTWSWFRSSSSYDVLVTVANSGWIRKVIEEVGKVWTIPVVAVYGIAQPVLPAAVAEPSIPLWKTIAIFRSAGWYGLAPFLIYGMFALWRLKDFYSKRILLWLAFVGVLWLLIASARGGGDATDNPRYRSLFIAWFALFAGWAIDWALTHRDVWLWRWLAVEMIFLSFFTNWYFSRYFHLSGRLSFWQMVIMIVVLSVVILAGGWAWDIWRARKGRLPSGVK